jgi:D-hydantoinase
MELIIKNGTIITATDRYIADIGIKDGKIHAIASKLENKNAEVIDATNRYVMPGAIDAHVHFQTQVGAFVSADNYESGSRAAACGGVTTVIDFAVQQKGQGLTEDVIARINEFKKQACIDFTFHTTITELLPNLEEEFEKSIQLGVTSFKLYMVYQGLKLDDGSIAMILETAKKSGVLIAVHAENPDIIDHRIAKFLKEGKASAWYHYESRPEFVEAEAIKRVVYLAKTFDAPLYIVHVACQEGLEEITKARDEGYKIYAETCPHYLNFTNEVYHCKDGVNFICSPSIKGEESQKALWVGIKRGDISAIATDHCPFQTYEKELGKEDFTKTPNGCMGTEILYPYLLSEANKGMITFHKAVEICSSNVARIFGIAPQKGTIAIGSDADIVIYDPYKKVAISKENMHSKVDYTIWEGMEMKGYPVMTFSRGKMIYEDGEFLGFPGWGQFVKCKPFH